MRDPRSLNAAKHQFFAADRYSASAYLRALTAALWGVEASTVGVLSSPLPGVAEVPHRGQIDSRPRPTTVATHAAILQHAGTGPEG